MSIKETFKYLNRDTSYDHRKILNSEELIKTAKIMGHTYAEIAVVCGVSKTMISHWGNPNKTEKPTYAQLEPMFERYDRGRFLYELEALPSSAIEYKKDGEYILYLILFGGLSLLLLFFWTMMIKPCSDNWIECKELPWYRMGSYEMIKFEEDLKEFKAWKKMSEKEIEGS